MKTSSRFFGCTVVLSLWLVAAVALPLDPRKNSDKHLITVRGSLTMANLVDTLGKSFTKENPDIVVAVSGGGAKAGFKALAEHRTDIVMSARKARKDEKVVALRGGIQVQDRQIGSDTVSVFVNPAVSVNALTLEQLRQIYRGDLCRWKKLRGPNTLIEAYSMPDLPRGLVGWFRSNVMDSAAFGPRTVFVKEPLQLIRSVTAARGGIGYLGSMLLAETLTQEHDLKVTVIKLARDSAAPAVLPSQASIKDGTYPLTTNLFFYWDYKSPKKGVTEFVDFCTTKAAERQQGPPDAKEE